MNKTYEIYLVSDSTGETLDRIFLALHAQFSNFKYKSHLCSFTRTENQIIKILQVYFSLTLIIIIKHSKIKKIKGILTDNINDVFSVKPSRLKK